MLKKLTLLTALFIAGTAASVAQTNYSDAQIDSLRREVASLRKTQTDRDQADKNKKIFGRQKSFYIGYAMNHWKPKDVSAFSPNYGANLSINKTYFVHKNPIAGFLKFGVDATWMDITYINYTASPDWSDFIGYDPDFDYGNDNLDQPNLGSHQIDLALGVGLSATFAPFFRQDNSLNQLKAKVYCHFLPSFSMMLISEPDDTRFNYAFVPYVTAGIQISWKAIGIFLEGRWGSGNYKIGGLNDDDNYYDDNSVPGLGDILNFDKIGCRNYGIRAGISLCY